MKEGTQKVGGKSNARTQLVVRVARPETAAEALAVCDGSEPAFAALFNRGLDIWRQDRIGRPMFEAGATAEEIEKAMREAVPGTTKGRGRPKKPTVIELPKTRDGKLSKELVESILAKHGIVTTEAQ